MTLIKFGEKEHLQMLKEGSVHFNPLSRFREDTTLFRGDELEGKYIIDTSKGFFIDGIDISKFGEGARATLTYEDSDDALIFCAAVLDSSNSQFVDSHRINVEDSFIEEMRKFGQYAIVFDGATFVSKVNSALDILHCNRAYHGVEYCNKNNHVAVHSIIQKLKPILDNDTIYFIKDERYKLQHEWRYVIDYIAGEDILNSDKSFTLPIEPFPMSDIMDIDKMKQV